MGSRQIIHLQHAAPPKPAPGAACNGCGVCCAAVPCPLAMLLFRRRHGACPALEWDAESRRYVCGLLVAPRQYLRWLPLSLLPFAQRAGARWIAAGKGCDCDAEIDTGNLDRQPSKARAP